MRTWGDLDVSRRTWRSRSLGHHLHYPHQLAIESKVGRLPTRFARNALHLCPRRALSRCTDPGMLPAVVRRALADRAHERARERRNVQITDLRNNFAQTHRTDLEQALRLVNACLLQPHQGRAVRFRLVALEQDHRAIKRVVRTMLGLKRYRGFVSIRFASLDHPSEFQPMLDIWASSAQPWVCLDQAIPHFPQSPQQPSELDGESDIHRTGNGCR